MKWIRLPGAFVGNDGEDQNLGFLQFSEGETISYELIEIAKRKAQDEYDKAQCSEGVKTT